MPKETANQEFQTASVPTDDPPTTYKLQFEFSPSAKKRLEELKDRTEASTKAEVVRNALRLYEWLVTQVDTDATIIVEDRVGHIKYRIPAKAFLT